MFEKGTPVIVTGPGNYYPFDLWYDRPLADEDTMYFVAPSIMDGDPIPDRKKPQYQGYKNWHRLMLACEPGTPQRYYDAPEEFIVDASEFGVEETRMRALAANRELLAASKYVEQGHKAKAATSKKHPGIKPGVVTNKD